MLSFVPLVMIAGFGYALYRWCLSPGTRGVAKRRSTSDGSRVAAKAVRDDKGTAGEDKSVAARAGAHC